MELRDTWSYAPTPSIDSTVASGSASVANLEGHVLDLIASTGEPVAMCQKSESNEGDKMWKSLEWHPLHGILSLTSIWGTSREYNLLSAESVSFIGGVDTRLRVMLNLPPGDKKWKTLTNTVSFGVC